ncbi:hypothetical protein GLOTRDRAFT_96526 [Gloeophyllum trabeum ATCC 11539]|uniref:Uncharacterized protein n=1 Tax=Gloeophyllum trabeum (strain ATCC 11539 / FP-39264 / Madison 617) TaxID=670483 RepID=S7PVF8_GLOTA|nr:uncharacterized protein GLOTRDRAFT_96526 [Gloeophyllum trabeum ATCC 11539]EPQ51382.1 hypothetical protein GLOTRDRAFT_96526 [Gloeophyllum trabeum ATCC 11539]
MRLTLQTSYPTTTASPHFGCIAHSTASPSPEDEYRWWYSSQPDYRPRRVSPVFSHVTSVKLFCEPDPASLGHFPNLRCLRLNRPFPLSYLRNHLPRSLGTIALEVDHFSHMEAVRGEWDFYKFEMLTKWGIHNALRSGFWKGQTRRMLVECGEAGAEKVIGLDAVAQGCKEKGIEFGCLY